MSTPNTLAQYFEQKEIKVIEEARQDKPDTLRHWRVDLNAKEAFALPALLEKQPSLWAHNQNNAMSRGNDDSWYGGTREDFRKMGEGEMDMAPFNKARASLKGFHAKVQEDLAPIGRLRKRTMSEHDGEWMPDRKWEVQQFSSTHKENSGILPTLQIDVDFSFSANISGSEITKFGAFCWAVTDAIEAAGITTGVNLHMGVMFSCSGGKMAKRGKNCLFNFAVKSPGDYTDSLSIARCFTPAFFRQGAFVAFYGLGTLTGDKVDNSIGSPYIPSRPISEPGKIFLRREDLKQSPEDMAERVLEALGHKGEAHA